jgi:outer membrane protein TolC
MKKILCLLSLIGCTSLYGQIQFKTLQECVEYSRKNNVSLKIDHLNHEISQEKVTSAWASLLPQVKAFGTFDDNIKLPVQLVPAQIFGGPEGEYAKLKFGTRYTATYGAEASLSLVNVSNWKNIKSSHLAEEASLFQAKDRELTVTEQLVSSYYFALLSREAIILNQELVNAGDSLLSAADVRLHNGLIEPLEFNRVKSLYLESLQQLRDSEGAYQKNLNTLKILAGLSEGDSIILHESIAGIIQQHQSPSSLNVPAQQLPRYKMLSAKALQAQEDLQRQRSKILPELSMYARVSRQSFSNEFNFFSSQQPWFDVAVVGLRAEWSLFTGFNRQSTIRQASLQRQIAQYELDNYTSQAEKELQELRINHQLASQGIARYGEHYQLNAINHRIAGEKYTQGVYTIDQYVNIYQEMVRSQNQYLNKLANYLVYESIVTSRNTLN